MNLAEMKTSALRTFHKGAFELKKHSPEIFVVAGVLGAVTAAVMACRATTKLHDVLDPCKTDVQKIHECAEAGCIHTEDQGDVPYTKDDASKDLAITYAKTGVNLIKLYGPSVILGGLSIAAIIASNNILRQRNVALGAAYAVVDKGFKEYRSRVKERFGDEVDRELRYNIKTREVEETVVHEDGTQTVEKETVEVVSGPLSNPYARFFDDGCRGWVKSAEDNLCYLTNLERWCNELLETRGHLFLNEIYEQLGIRQTKEGHTVGWIWAPGVYIDFGLNNVHRESVRNFVNGLEPVYLMDFNPQGDIMHVFRNAPGVC